MGLDVLVDMPDTDKAWDLWEDEFERRNKSAAFVDSNCPGRLKSVMYVNLP